MSLSDFQKRLWLSSVPLVRLNEQRLPAGIASGCLIDYSGKRLLLTVSHATGDQENWAIQQKYVPGKGTCIYQLGAMNFLSKATSLKPTLEDVDFSYAEVAPGFTAYRQEIEAPDNSVKSETPIDVHALNCWMSLIIVKSSDFAAWLCRRQRNTSGKLFRRRASSV